MVYLTWISLLNFFFLIFSEISEPTCLKFGHSAWIGPEGDHSESFITIIGVFP